MEQLFDCVLDGANNVVELSGYFDDVRAVRLRQGAAMIMEPRADTGGSRTWRQDVEYVKAEGIDVGTCDGGFRMVLRELKGRPGR